MKCIRCGIETVRRGRNQKYCPKCAELSRIETVKLWRENHRRTVTEAQCQKCGAKVAKYRHYCDNCLAEKNRVYQREYKRRIRAKK